MKKKIIKQIYKTGMRVRCLADDRVYELTELDRKKYHGDCYFFTTEIDACQVYNSHSKTLAEIIELPKKEVVEVVPEYVKMLICNNNFLFTKGKIYKTTKNGGIRDDINDSTWFDFQNETEPSTKEAYEAQQEENKPICTIDNVEYSEETLRSIIKKATN